jgi:TIR domain/Pentapeptide repeats (8 copies)
MANEEHLKILKQGVEVWNKWRKDNPEIKPDLSEAPLSNANLHDVDFSVVNLRGADLDGAQLKFAKFGGANLARARLRGALLGGVDFFNTNLENADLSGADINFCTFWWTNLKNTDFVGARMALNRFSEVDLGIAVNLSFTRHFDRSFIDISTLYKSGGNIPSDFLRESGIPDDFITFIPSHFGIQEAIQFYSCFISYSTRDEEFARRLYSRMRDEKLRVWFAPEDMKGGILLQEQIEQAIQLHDRLLVVLSDESMASEWVKREIRNARRAEKKEGRRKLFPIRLVDYKAIEEWKGFDGDGGEDLAFELGKFYVPDFSNWKDHDTFEREFAKLVRDLRAEERRS